jgi:hypothetical protein
VCLVARVARSHTGAVTECAGGPYALTLEQFDRLVRVPEDVREAWVPAAPPGLPYPGTWLAPDGGTGGDASGCDGD